MRVDKVRCYNCKGMFEPYTNERYCSDECHTAANKPLAVGGRVRHHGQQWRRARRKGTGNILKVDGPVYGGGYEYLIQHDGTFSGDMFGEPDPPSWWASHNTIPVAQT